MSTPEVDIMATVLRKIQNDSDRFLKRLDAAENRLLFRSGAYFRTVLRRTFPRRKTISRPGQPPHAHGNRLKGLPAFNVDTTRKTVTAGMRVTGGLNRDLGASLDGGGITRAKRRGRVVRQKVRRRPFMRRAIEKSLPRLRQIGIESLRSM